MSDIATNPPRQLNTRFDGGNVFATEPALVIGAVTTVVDTGLILLFLFISGVSADQQVAIIAFVTSVIATISALVTRTQVTPAKK